MKSRILLPAVLSLLLVAAAACTGLPALPLPTVTPASGATAGAPAGAAATPNVEPTVPLATPAAEAKTAPGAATLAGTLTYLERVALPDNATITVQLADVSDPSAPPELIAQQDTPAAGQQVPLPFDLAYDPSSIDPDKLYALMAYISVDGQVEWTTMDMVFVLTQGAPVSDVQLILTRTGTEGAREAGPTPAGTVEGVVTPEPIATGEAPGAAGSEQSEQGLLTGTVTYRQRIALPAGSVINVQLLDVSRADAPAVLLGEQVITTQGEQAPFPFEISYDRSQVDARMNYSIRASIKVDDKPRFVSTRMIPVLTHGAPGDDVLVHVEPVGGFSDLAQP